MSKTRPAAGQRVVIIGAGIGGLATANLLAAAGYHVEVYEKSAEAGGRVGRFEQDGFKFETGPSWFLMKDVFEHYYKLLGVSLQDELELIRLDPAYKVFYEHQPPVTITSDIKRDAHTFEAIEPGAGSRLEAYLAGSRKQYDLALKHFLYTNFRGTKNLRHRDIIRNSPALIKLAIRPIHEYVAKRFSDRRLQQILEYHMVFLGVSPYKAPGIYSLMSALDLGEGVFYPKRGMYSLVESLEDIGESLGVQYHYKAPVDRIITRKGRATGIMLESTKLVAADIVISNADLHFTETRLLQPSDQSFPQEYWDNKTASPSALLILLGVAGSIPEFEHHNLLFVEAWKQNFDNMSRPEMPHKASLYICKTSATDPHAAPAGQENIFILVPIPAGIELDKEAEQHYATHYLERIHEATGVDLAGRASQMTVYGPGYFDERFSSWQSSMLGPAHTLSQSALFRTPNRSRKVSNLFYVGAGTRPGIGLPMCVIGAELIYKHLAGDTSAGPVDHIERIGQADGLAA